MLGAFLAMGLGMIFVCGCATSSRENTALEGFMAGTVSAAGAEEDVAALEGVWKEIGQLDAQGSYDISYDLVRRTLFQDFSEDNLAHALNHAEKHLLKLRKMYAHEKTVFDKRYDVLEDGLPTGKRKTKSKDMVREERFNLIETEKARRIAEEFDACGQNLAWYISQIVRQYPPSGNKELLRLKKKAEQLKKAAMLWRCEFISYGVMAPYYAECARQLFLADGEWYRLFIARGHELHRALDFIAAPAHRQWLLESNLDVRKQFFALWKEMKSEAGKAEWEEFVAWSGLSDTIDPSKGTGQEGWWRRMDEAQRYWK